MATTTKTVKLESTVPNGYTTIRDITRPTDMAVCVWSEVAQRFLIQNRFSLDPSEEVTDVLGRAGLLSGPKPIKYYIFFKKRVLWLDDVRNPAKFRQPTAVWVKTVSEFILHIKDHGLPDEIWFDHDLGETETGVMAARWLIGFCQETNQLLPKWYCHSANPCGKKNIESLLSSYELLGKI